MKRTLVIGVGNPGRGDDDAGLEAARRLEALHCPGLRVRRMSGDGASLIEAWRGADHVVLVDAVLGAGPPGRVVRFDGTDGVPGHAAFPQSSHAFGLAEALELGRVLGRLPHRLVVYGIQARSFAQGAPLSPEVASSVRTVVRRVLREMDPRGSP